MVHQDEIINIKITRLVKNQKYEWKMYDAFCKQISVLDPIIILMVMKYIH